MADVETPSVSRRDVRAGIDVDRTPVLVGAGLIGLLSLTALLVPLFAIMGGAVVGGFVAAYLAPGAIRGPVHGIAAGLVGGFGHGVVTVAIGGLIGLYTEPPTLVGWLTGPIAPFFGYWNPLTPLLIMGTITVMVALDAAIGALVGTAVRGIRDQLAG